MRNIERYFFLLSLFSQKDVEQCLGARLVNLRRNLYLTVFKPKGSDEPGSLSLILPSTTKRGRSCLHTEQTRSGTPSGRDRSRWDFVQGGERLPLLGPA